MSDKKKMNAPPPHSEGKGPGGGANKHAVMFLHGFLGCGDDWAEIAQHLEPDYRVLAPDLPGHGGAVGLPHSAYTMDGAADDLIQSLDIEDIHKASVVGYSMGGRLALHLALRHPNRVERLMLLSASPGLCTDEERAARRAEDQRRADEIEVDLEGFLERWYRMPLFGSLDESTREALIATRSQNNPAELRRSLEGMGTGAQPSHWQRLHQIRVPAWAVAGADDAKFVEIANRIAETPSFNAVVVPDASHALLNERPEYVASLLRNLLFH